MRFPFIKLSVGISILLFSLSASAQNTGDYRSKQTGQWSNTATWEKFDGTNWINATVVPSSADGVLSIRAGHTVTVAGNEITIDQLTVNAGAFLTLETNLNFNDGTGDDLVVDGTFSWNGGQIRHTAGSRFVCNGIMNIAVDQSMLINGNGTCTFINNGTINKSNTGTTNSSVDWINNGFMNLTAGTFFNSSNFTNAGILFFSNNALFQNGANPGQIFYNNAGSQMTGTGKFDNLGNLYLNASLVFPLTVQYSQLGFGSANGTGDLTINNDFTLNGSINNAGSFNVNNVIIKGDITGTSAFNIAGNVDWQNAGNINRSFTITAGHTLTMSTNANRVMNGNLTNNGTINWSDGPTFFLSSSGATITNNGVFNINLSVNSSITPNGGGNAFLVNNGAIVKQGAGISSFDLTVTNNSTGVFQGNGTISFNANYLFTNNGFISPGLSPGILTVNGSQPLSSISKLEIEIAGNGGAGQPTGHDLLQRAGSMTLGGTLNVAETGTTASGDYTIISLTSGTISGTFSTANIPLLYSIIYNITTVVLRKEAFTTYYRDLDADGFGDPDISVQAGSQPAGYVIDNTDCDDNNAAVHPGATEVCNGIDDDCDGQVDEGSTTTFYRDLDGDSYGSEVSGTVQACSAPTGYVADNTDCNDNNAAVHPGATEVCNGIDDDCDGQVDEGVTTTFYRDLDGDGYGKISSGTIQACSAPSGYVANQSDCNDNNAAVHPGATEVCNGMDDNCNQAIDEGVTTTFYRDLDGDGYGKTGSGTIQACSVPSGYVTGNTDCNDNNAAIHPGATEVCNGIDDNCNGQIDEGLTSVYFRDLDGDGYGKVVSGTINTCNPPPGYVLNSNDCNDNNAAVHPGATEVCNGIDDNCNGQIDEGLTSVYFRDLDGDGYGNDVSGSINTCNPPPGYVVNNSDCNDNNAAVHPGATEVCNGIDDNCNGQIDEGVIIRFYRDFDGDGYGNPNFFIDQCSAPSGFVVNNSDCNDGNAAVNPGVTEVCNGIDDDCDGLIDEGVKTTFYRDLDGDGYGNPNFYIDRCIAPSGFVTDNTDCNDNNASIHPGATEICNGIDDNCNGQIDEGVKTTFYRDQDGDGFGNAGSGTIQACSAPSGYVVNNMDCNDNNAAIHPGATEICNGIDENCNGIIDEGAQPIQITLIPNGGAYAICAGSTFTISAIPANGVYQWYKNGIPISGQSGSTLVVNSTGVYYARMAGGICSRIANFVFVIVVPLPNAAISVNGSLNICRTGSVQLIASAGVLYAYQWKRNGLPVAGATQRSYVATQTGVYTVTVTNVGTLSCPVTSSPVTVINTCANTPQRNIEEVEETMSYSKTIRVYPNPATSQFVAEMNFADARSGDALIQVSDLTGRVLLSQNAKVIKGRLHTPVEFGSQYKDGLYMVKVLFDNKTYSASVVKLTSH